MNIGYSNTNDIDDFKDLKVSNVVYDNKEDLETLYFYFSNIPASEKEPFTFVLEGQTIFTSHKDIPDTEVIILDTSVNVSEFREIGQVVLQTTIKIPKVKVHHMQQFDVSKSGEYIMIGLDPIRKCISISQSHEEFKLQSHQTLNTTMGHGPKNDKVERKKVNKVFFKLNKLPADNRDPFQIYIDRKLIYQFTKNLTLETEISVNLPWPQEEILLTCKYNGNQQIEKKLIMEQGEYLRVARDKKHIQIFQNLDGIFEREKLPQVTVQFYLLNLKVGEQPFQIGVSGSIIYETTELKQFKGVKYDFDAPLDHGDMILNLEIIHPSQGIVDELDLNLTQNGTHILLEYIDLGKMNFYQRKSEFLFTQDSSGKFFIKDDGKSLQVEALEQTDDIQDDGLKESAYIQIDNLLEIGMIDQKEYDKRRREIDCQ